MNLNAVASREWRQPSVHRTVSVQDLKMKCTDLALIFILICVNITQGKEEAEQCWEFPQPRYKCVLLKSKKGLIKVQKHIRKVVPHSSKLHAFLSRKSSVYHRVNNDFSAISDHKHKSAKKQRLSFNEKHYPSNYCYFTKQQRFYLLFVQTRTPKHKRLLPVFILMNRVQRNFIAPVYNCCVWLIV